MKCSIKRKGLDKKNPLSENRKKPYNTGCAAPQQGNEELMGGGNRPAFETRLINLRSF